MFLDTTILIDIFVYKDDSKEFQRIFECVKDEILYISVIQIGEISDWCLKNDLSALEFILRIKKIVNVVPLTEKICLDGSKMKFQIRKMGTSKFGLVDGIILASARSMDEDLLTKDNDFRGFTGVKILSRVD